MAPLKMVVALCAVLLVIVAGQQPAMAYDDDDSGAGPSGLACPSPVTTCRTQCTLACIPFSQQTCDGICSLTQSLPLVGGLGQICVNQVVTACISSCKNLCELLPVPPKTSP